MNVTDAYAQLRDIVGLLEPARLQAAGRDYVRGGLPAQSMAQGAGSGEAPLPLPDRTDREWDRDWRAFTSAISRAINDIAGAHRIQTRWLELNFPENEMVNIAPPCQNPSCGKVLEGNRRSGECVRCRVWRTNHDGQPYPRQAA